MRVNLGLKIVLFLMLIVSVFPALAEDEYSSIPVDGEDRTYYLYVPDDLDESEPVPLVMALHPAAWSGRTMAIHTHLNEYADALGFIVVYPETLDISWSDGRLEAGIQAPIDEPIDDLGFLESLKATLMDEYNIDPERVFLTGFNSGGLVAYRAACELPDVFSGFAVVGAIPWEYYTDVCEDAEFDTDLLIINGTENHIYPPEGRTLSALFDASFTPRILSEDEALEFFSERFGCEAEGESDLENVRIFDNCRDDARLAFYSVVGGGLNWPRTGDYALNQFGLDGSQMILDFFLGEDWAVEQVDPSGVIPRTYTYYVPQSYDPETPAPLVITLHGRFGTGAGTASLSGFNDLAEEEGFIALYPDGLTYPNSRDDDYGWRYSRLGQVVQTEDRESQINDTQFLADLIDDLALDLNIDRERVYVSGLSNGGFMVHRLACEDPDRYAAYASVAGSGFAGLFGMCEEGQHAPMFIIHGTLDNNILWDGIQQNVGGRTIYTSYPVLDMVAFWATQNDCGLTATQIEIPELGNSPGTLVRGMEVDECPPNAAVLLYGIVGGGHNWPGVPGAIPDAVAGNVNQDINTAEELWKFFSRFPEEDVVEAEMTPEPEVTEESTPEQ